MQVSIAPPPGAGKWWECHTCEQRITATHVKTQTDRKERHFCNGQCFGKWRLKKHKEAA